MTKKNRKEAPEDRHVRRRENITSSILLCLLHTSGGSGLLVQCLSTSFIMIARAQWYTYGKMYLCNCKVR